jgi:heterotetrameric sarcosine oxidase gamma subunit
MEGGNVAEYRLTSEEFLDGYQAQFGPISLREISDICMVSMAVPLAEEQAVQKALKAAFGIDMPDIGQSQGAAALDSRVLRMGLDHMFVLFARAQNTERPEQQIKTLMKSAVYTTDQSHNWVGLEISGPGCRSALERICPIDLHPERFAVNAVARTQMEHLGTIILCVDQETYWLFSASSSAKSFLHALETSIHNVQ